MQSSRSSVNRSSWKEVVSAKTGEKCNDVERL